MFNTILFDLDGTLTNPYIGITSGILYALEKLGVERPPRESLVTFIGPPLFDELQRRFGFDDDTAREGVRLYREYYSAGGLFENELIDGAEDLLKTLKARGKRICLATSKPEEYARRILERFRVLEYFDFVGGATLDGRIGTKAEVIRLVLRETGADPSECVLVGDRFHDILGAHETGMKCICVLVGFGSREEYAQYGADFVAETLAEVNGLV
ncbi:MAG: HAD-IA family hydrolase [Oscillospiraceae bacterium]